ncbi:hypothetical protein ABT354_29335 [Streptomyces sp. NPDC000594]|uniref:hypothetical protein n=1 Tax=Streptomyces sp. NPDC000594 TaxID=3154261 RepID=UPI003333BB7C
MTHTYGRTLRAASAVLAGALLWTGCAGSGAPGGGADSVSGGGDSVSGSGTGDTGGTGKLAAEEAAAAVAGAPATRGTGFEPDPERLPRTAAQARKLAGEIVAGPELWGADFVERSPRLSPPGYWPVLDEGCGWRGGTLPDTVLASVTAHSELPAGGGKGPVRVAATVTVHRDVRAADWEMAGTLEEALRCPAQKLREGERVSGLSSIGEETYTDADDSLGEIGVFTTDEFPGKHGYGWFQSRVGQITVAAVAKGAKGHSGESLRLAQAKALSGMVVRLERRLEARR